MSGLLFVIGIEILARAIKNDAGIKGIKVGEKEIKVSLYADDTTVFVRDLDSITHLLSLLDRFKSLSGLEISTKKTEGMWLGSWKNNTETPFGFRWPRDPIKALGIFFSYDLKVHCHGILASFYNAEICSCINGNPKIMMQFCYLGLYHYTETIYCCLSLSKARMEMD